MRLEKEDEERRGKGRERGERENREESHGQNWVLGVMIL